MNKQFIKNGRIDYNGILFLVIPFLFYLFFSFFDGVVLCVDTPTYTSMSISREPIYPLLIDLCRKLIGENNNYLFGVVIIQGLLTAYVTYDLTNYLTKEYNLKSILGYVIMIILLSISLMNRFFAERASMYSNSILSEGIAYPLFLLFFRYIVDYINDYSNKSLIICSILSFVMISTRKQMYLSLALLIISICYICIKNKDYLKGFIKLFICVAFVLGGCRLFDRFYINVVHGLDSNHASDNRFLTTMIFYVSEREDAEYIEDKQAKELFLDIYDYCSNQGYMKSCATGTWFEKLMHLSNNYDNIQTKNMWPMMEDYVENELQITGVEKELEVDKFNNIFISSLLPKVLPRLISTILLNMIGGFIITVSAEREIFAIYSLLIYTLYIGLLVYLFTKERLSKYTIIGLITIVALVINVALVSTVIFNQTRYTMYCMPQFYIALLIMIYRILEIKGLVK